MSVKIVGPEAKVYTVKVEEDSNGQVLVKVVNAINGVVVGTIVRMHPSSGGDLIAGDYPGLDPSIFTTGPVSGDDKLING